MEKNFYQLLAVSVNASPVDIRRAFHRLARQSHPDTAPPGAADAERFHELLCAYRILSSPSKRALYDRRLAAMEQAPGSLLLRVWGQTGGFGWRWLKKKLIARKGIPPSRLRKPDSSPRATGGPKRDHPQADRLTFRQILTARQNAKSFSYVLCEDGIIRPKTAVIDKQQSGQRLKLRGVLRNGWGILLLLVVGYGSLFHR